MIVNLQRLRLRSWLCVLLSSLIVNIGLAQAQDEIVNSAPAGGSLLVLLMGLGAVLLVGLVFIVRERFNKMDVAENGPN